MSLTHPFGIKQKAMVRAITQVTPKKNEFISLGGGPCFNKNQKCLVPYGLPSPQLATRCGVAFDYLARFLVAQKVKSYKDDALSELVAERVFTMSSTKWFGYEIERDNGLSWYRSVLEEISNAITEDRVLSQHVVECCVLLGKMEQEKRGGRTKNPKFELTEEDDLVVRELMLLASVFQDTFVPLIDEKSEIIFNPTFGESSRMIGGADADIYINGVIYDFKVHKENKWSLADARQLIGYYVLDSIAKDVKDAQNKLKSVPVKKVALYNARYGEIAFYDIARCNPFDIQKAKEEIRFQYLKYGLQWCEEKDIEKLGVPLSTEELQWCKEFTQDDIDIWMKIDFEKGKYIVDINERISAFLKEADTVVLMEKVIALKMKRGKWWEGKRV